MQYYFAPMEGITTYIYRNLFHKHFKGVDKYFTPFVSPTMHGCFTPRERKDILPEHNQGLCVVPQILTNQGNYFVETARQLQEYGYEEVNLNLGCPSNTVVTKGKGAGFLSEPYRLEKFLDQIFRECSMKISIKTRIGHYEEEEFEVLLGLFEKYPLEELIIHPRVQQDYYKHPVRVPVFLNAMENSNLSLCYNGDLYTVDDERKIKATCPDLERIMFGRGLIGNPMLLEEIRGFGQRENQRLKKFLDELYASYYEEMGNNALFKMKELWIYMGTLFPEEEKLLKKIKKSRKNKEYLDAVEQLFYQVK